MRKRVVFEARNGAQGARTSREVCGGAREQGERGGTGRAGDGGRSLRGSSATAVLKLVRGNLDGEDAPGSPCRRDPWGNRGGITSKTQPLQQSRFTDDDGPRADGTTYRDRRVCPRLLAADARSWATVAHQHFRQAPRRAGTLEQAKCILPAEGLRGLLPVSAKGVSVRLPEGVFTPPALTRMLSSVVWVWVFCLSAS